MPDSHLHGNEEIKRAVASNRVPHAMLFTGADGAGKMEFAKTLAIELLGPASAHKVRADNHPDLHLYVPESKGSFHSIEQIRQCIQEMELPPYEACAKVFIIDKAHQMPPVSSNALLKTLEEPPPRSYLILLSDQPDQLLPTIRSRCQSYPFLPPVQQEIAEDPLVTQLLQAWWAADPRLDETALLKCCQDLDDMLGKDFSIDQIDLLLSKILVRGRELPLRYFEEAFLCVERAHQAILRHVRPRVVFEWLRVAVLNCQ